MSAVIKSFLEFTERPLILAQLTEIFFESSSKKTFRDQADRDAFFYKYLGFYLEHDPEHLLLAWDKKVLGYLALAPISKSPELYSYQPHLQVFEDLFKTYPAHVHINCHVESRGQGVGEQLMQYAFKVLADLKSAGVHIMTAPEARNCSFYTRLGFSFTQARDYQGTPILFMGKRLSENML